MALFLERAMYILHGPNLLVPITGKVSFKNSHLVQLKSKGNPPEEEGLFKWTCRRIVNNERFFSLSVLKRVKGIQDRDRACILSIVL